MTNFSSLNEATFLQVLRDILDDYFHRQRSSNSIDQQVRKELEDLLQHTNPSDPKIADRLPKNLQTVYRNFIHDYRRDIERYHIQRASEFIDEYRLKNFDWNIRIALHDEHLFKCRLPLLNLQLELTNEQQSRNILLELDEQELDRLIDEMSKIEQTMNNINPLL